MPPKTLEYETQVDWTGNRGQGTRTYVAYSRDHRILAPGRPSIEASADPDFRGDPRRYSPEDLLVASVSACHMLWYLHLCADAGVVVTGYRDRARGRMELDPGGGGRFREVVLRPEVTLGPDSDVDTARRLHAEAHGKCFIANSMSFPVTCEPQFEVRESVRRAEVQVLPMEEGHWEAVRRIYAQGIDTGVATFETEVPEWDAWDAAHMPAPRLVAVEDDAVTGWAALSPVSSRCVYGGVAEVSVYVGEDHRGKGVGSTLLRRLVDASEAEGIWTLQAGIFPENEASIELHRRAGFREVGRREKLGKLDGAWRDVILLERRCPD